MDYRGRGPIHIAAIAGNMEMVEFLIEQRVNLDFVDQTGMSALYLAIFFKNSAIAERLNACGATCIVPKSRLEILLCQAGFEGDYEFIRLLNICGADLNLCDYDRRTLGHLAACENHRDVLIYLATKTNFNFKFKDRFGKDTLEEIQDPQFREEIEHMINNRNGPQ